MWVDAWINPYRFESSTDHPFYDVYDIADLNFVYIFCLLFSLYILT